MTVDFGKPAYLSLTDESSFPCLLESSCLFNDGILLFFRGRIAGRLLTPFRSGFLRWVHCSLSLECGRAPLTRVATAEL
jgi:hypothetical protein